ncbi:MAG TPA: DUF1775 domain-containing protein [Ferrovibrio sp.]|uniref:DUF1775 domain-containing protein n=1 Tax=Ferrovibrio sp. TaxID=1917215 RepID=UPI002ED18AA9
MSRPAMTGAALVAFLAAMPAFAHISADPANAAAGSYFHTSLRVPHGCDGQATTAIRVGIPDGILGATPQAKPGWQVAIEKKALPQPVEALHGQRIDHVVSAVTWSGGNLPDDQFDDFGLVLQIPKTAGAQYWLPITQTCGSARLLWSQIPAKGQSRHDLEYPAVLIRVADNSGMPGGMMHDHMQMGQTQAKQPGTADAKPAATIGDIGIVAPFARATPAKVGGAFMQLTNSGKTDDKLIRAAAPVAENVEIHEHAMEGGAMRMRPVDGVPIPAGGTALLQPGGYHVMMIGLKHPLKQGDHFPLTLTFEKAGTVTVDVPVLTPGATSATPGAMPGNMPGGMHPKH